MDIRHEVPGDIPAIRALNRLAFEGDQEARIIDALRANHAVQLSLVAEAGGRIVGHIMYSPVQLGGVTGSGLGPMAVLPETQRQGIGTRLVEAGNRWLSDRRCPFIVVVGHPEFYRRFGFVAAHTYGVTCEWSVPDDVFMMRRIDEAVMADARGLARYRAEFSDSE